MSYLFILLLTLLSLATAAIEPYKNAALPVNTRVNDLLSKMTLEEKVNQLLLLTGQTPESIEKTYGHTGVGYHRYRFTAGGDPAAIVETRNKIQAYMMNNTRLGIPIGFYVEALHSGGNNATVFPQSCGLGPSWNMSLITSIYDTIGREARINGADMGFTPVINLFTDPRFGRQQEGYTEDPVLLAAITKAATQAFQGGGYQTADQYLNPKYTMSLAKHFAAYGMTQGGINASPADLSLQRLHEIYLAPWKAYTEAGGRGLMVAHNTINGVPCHGNPYLLQDVLRKQFNWTQGVTMSDENDIGVLQDFNIVADPTGAASLGVNAGVDIDLGAHTYPNLISAVKSGTVSQATLDRSVRNVLRQKFAAGIFDNPMTNPAETKELDNEKNRNLAKEAALQGAILLQNDGSLPLDVSKLKSIAVIGPNGDGAAAERNQLGSYTSYGAKVTTVYEAIQRDVGSTISVKYVQGASTDTKDTSGIEAAVALAKESDVSILVLGDSLHTSAEWGDRADLDLPGGQMQLLTEVAASNKKSGKTTIVVLIHGRTATFGEGNAVLKNISALFSAWRPGEEGGSAIWELISGARNPSAKTTRSWIRTVGQVGGPSNPWYSLRAGKWLANFKTEYRQYVFQPSTPLFPFGYGLSYTTFKFTNPSATLSGSKVTVTATVENTGSRDGDVVVQAYIEFPVSPIVRYWKWLGGWNKVHMMKGESKTVEISMDVSQLGYYDASMAFRIQKGTYTVLIGEDSTATLATTFSYA